MGKSKQTACKLVLQGFARQEALRCGTSANYSFGVRLRERALTMLIRRPSNAFALFKERWKSSPHQTALWKVGARVAKLDKGSRALQNRPLAYQKSATHT